MQEDPVIIQLNIERYRAMLTLCRDRDQQSRIERLLDEAITQLALIDDPERQS